MAKSIYVKDVGSLMDAEALQKVAEFESQVEKLQSAWRSMTCMPGCGRQIKAIETLAETCREALRRRLEEG